MGVVAVQTGSAAGQVRRPRLAGLRLTLSSLLILSLVATGVSVASFFVPGAVLSALVAAFFYALLVIVRLVDRRAPGLRGGPAAPGARRPAAHAESEEDDLDVTPEISQEVVVAERAGLRTGLLILAPLAVLAVVLAAVLVGWRVVGLGALAFFAIMVFMGAPVWLAAVEDEIDEEEERIGIDMHSIR